MTESNQVLEYRQGLLDLSAQLTKVHTERQKQADRRKAAAINKKKIEKRLAVKPVDPGNWKPGTWDLNVF